jgi:hypothetical protein
MSVHKGVAVSRVVAFLAVTCTASGLTISARAGQAKATPADCDRACLGAVLDSYFGAIAKHDPSMLPVAGNVRFTENGRDLKFGEGLWQRGGPASYRMDAIDAVNGQAASNAVILENGKNAILFVRLKVDKKKVTEVETTIVRPGEGQRSDPEALSQVTSTPYKDVIPPGQRDTRERLVSAADAYFIGLETSGTDQYKAPPATDDARRVENGAGARNVGAPRVPLVEQLRRGFGGAKLFVSDRRYPVVDEEHGIVLAIGLMHVNPPAGVSDGPPGHVTDKPSRVQILVEFFKIAGGQIHQIQASMLDLDDPSNATVGITDTGWTARTQ